MVPSYLAVDSIQNIGLDVHLTTSQKQKASASISKKLISFMINQMQDFGKKYEAFGNWKNIITFDDDEVFTTLSEWSCYHKAKPDEVV